MKKIVFFQLIVAVCLIALFQNCSKSDTLFTQNSKATPALSSQNGSGQPYEGKPYILSGNVCADGTLVQARIIWKSVTSAQLVRENCQTIAPVELGESDFSVDGADQLTYLANVFVPEAPAVDLKLLTTWYYQLQKSLQAPPSTVYDIDMFNNSAATFQNLKAQGHIVLCYISAGSYEQGRPDAGSFSASDLGNTLGGGNADRWLDTRSASVRSILLARLDLAKSKGCDGVDLDNVDAFSSNSGFPLNTATQTDYNVFLARAAHDRGLFVALNNVGDLAQALVNDFDLVVAEECYATNECSKYQPFTARGKPVFDAEYTAYSSARCTSAAAASISLGFYSRQLDGTSFAPCP